MSPSLVKSGRQKGDQDLSQRVKNHVRHVLRAWAELKHRKNLRAGINGQPEKDAPVRRCAAGCVVRPAGGEGAGDGRRSARAGCVRAHQHGTERLVIVACRKPKTRRASDESSPSASRDEHQGDLVRWGFQTVSGSVAPGSERAATGRASKCLHALSTAMFAISQKTRGLEHHCCQSTGPAGSDRRSLRCLSEWRAPRRLFTSLQGRGFRRSCPSTQRGSGAETTGGAIVWGAWLQQTVERAALGPSS